MAKTNSILPSIFDEEVRLKSLILSGEATAADKVLYEQIADAIAQFMAAQVRAQMLSPEQTAVTADELALVSKQKIKFAPEALQDADGNVMLSADGTAKTVNIEVTLEAKEVAQAKGAFAAELERLNLSSNAEYYAYAQQQGLANPITEKTTTIYSLNEDAAVAAGFGTKVWTNKSKVTIK